MKCEMEMGPASSNFPEIWTQLSTPSGADLINKYPCLFSSYNDFLQVLDLESELSQTCQSKRSMTRNRRQDIVVDYKFAAENSSVIDDMYDMIGDQYYEIPADVKSSNITADDGKHIHSPAATPAHSYDNWINSGYADDSSSTDGVR